MIHTPIVIEEKEITINELGRMINRSFTKVDKDLVELEERVCKRLNTVEGTMCRIESKLDAGFRQMNARFDYFVLSQTPREDE